MMSEKHFKYTFAEILGGAGKPTPKTLAEIVKTSGHCRATVIKWLKKFEREGLITKNALINGRGRPKFVYSPRPALLTLAVRSVEFTPLSFSTLRGACKHQKLRFCYKSMKGCRLSNCPLIKSRHA